MKKKKYIAPSLECLNSVTSDDKALKETAEAYSDKILECLQTFKVNVAKAGYEISPINMVFDFTLLPDSSYTTVKNLVKDISLAVAHEVKLFQRDDKGGVFSISIQREDRSYVGLREIIDSDEYKNSESSLTIAAGVDELARSVVFDLGEAPHLMISGSTGTGKTVYLDDIILSIVYKSAPSDVKLVLIDPGIDLLAYEGLPHLLFKPLSRKDEVYEAVKSIKNLMDERYERLINAHVRDVDSYNEKFKKNMPRIVLIIDKYLEFTYEMPDDFEDQIKSIARKGRAAGVHLILNTQSARSNRVNGDIKANIPYRIAFSVTDWSESKAILESTGAQKLLGNGDMLLATGFNSMPRHVQAPSVELDEIQRVVADTIEHNGSAKYQFVFDSLREPIEDDLEYIVAILQAVSASKTIDIDTIQKKLEIEYAEALDVIKFLEDYELISKYNGNKKRNVDIETVDRWLEEFRSELAQSEENDE